MCWFFGFKTWDLNSGIESAPPALGGEVLSPGPPGTPPPCGFPPELTQGHNSGHLGHSEMTLQVQGES